MNSHFYLFRTSLKNHAKETLRKPGKLVLYLLVLLGLAGGIIASLFTSQGRGAVLPRFYLMPIFFAFLLLFYGIAIQKGLSSGDAIFEMSDVNLLFVSPVNPRATLLYGLIRLVGASFWAGFFLLFQGGTLANFGVAYHGALILFAVFILHTICLTLLSLVIYSATNGRPARKRLVRVLAAAALVPLLAGFAWQFAQTWAVLPALNALFASPLPAATPFVGWAAAGAIALIEGRLWAALAWLGLLAACGAGLLAVVMFSRADYYEDVLVATETAFERKRAAAEGDLQAAGATNARVRVKATGLSGGGARVFFYKHLRETFRQNRLGFLSAYMLVMAAGLTALAFFARGGVGVVVILQILLWMQIFMIGTGRGLLETYSHYIYLVPDSPFRKLLWSNMELMLRILAESVLFLGIPGLVAGHHPLAVLGGMSVYVFFSLLLLGVNYLFMRWLGANLSKGLLLTVYLFAVLLILAPGLAAALAAGFWLGGAGGLPLGLGVLSAWELGAALVCFALAKGVLNRCDMPRVKGP